MQCPFVAFGVFGIQESPTAHIAAMLSVLTGHVHFFMLMEVNLQTQLVPGSSQSRATFISYLRYELKESFKARDVPIYS